MIRTCAVRWRIEGTAPNRVPRARSEAGAAGRLQWRGPDLMAEEGHSWLRVCPAIERPIEKFWGAARRIRRNQRNTSVQRRNRTADTGIFNCRRGGREAGKMPRDRAVRGEGCRARAAEDHQNGAAENQTERWSAPTWTNLNLRQSSSAVGRLPVTRMVWRGLKNPMSQGLKARLVAARRLVGGGSRARSRTVPHRGATPGCQPSGQRGFAVQSAKVAAGPCLPR